ncbi:Uncharacterized protein OBRU01_06264 [Operophtera brumata]|uniref:C2H2-type domain-containing protein n=1 Tax=Operophtera brumata TaxID=104452 RepID=A0A0L7LLN1_OPEBR|nr:Uncharacterized protein OBRU01_06264 [Operophtera brumata]
MMEEDEFVGCISCMSSNNLCDLFSVYEDNGESYASMFKTCFDVVVEKRKAFICPLCSERVSYGAHFSAHLLHAHRVHEHVEQLQFHNMDGECSYPLCAERACYGAHYTRTARAPRARARGAAAGKGKRAAPERQIYKTGKACPAHMIVTESMEHVLVTFYKTHVGHGRRGDHGSRDLVARHCFARPGIATRSRGKVSSLGRAARFRDQIARLDVAPARSVAETVKNPMIIRTAIHGQLKLLDIELM